MGRKRAAKTSFPERHPTAATPASSPRLRLAAAVVLLAAALAAVLLACAGSIGDNDYGLHLRIGEEIAAAGRPPRDDHHSYTAPGHVYPDHEWLAQLLFYSLQGRIGDGGMVALKALLVALTLALVVVATQGPLALRLALASTVFLLGLHHVQMRPHLLSWVMCAALALLLRGHVHWPLPLLLLVWANTHGSVLLGVGVAGLHLLEDFARTRTRTPLLWAGACALVPLLSPAGWRIYTLFLEVSTHADFIGEWKPYTPGNGAFWLLVALFGITAGALLARAERRTPFVLVLVAVLAYLSFRASRNGVIAAIFLAPLLGAWYGPRVARWPGRLRAAAALLAAAPLLVVAILRLAAGEVPRFALDPHQLPIAAVQFLHRHRLEGRLFNDYNFGGYLLWRGWPEYPVFVDGRVEVFHGRPFEEYLRVSKAGSGWEEVLDRYRVDLVLVRPERDVARALLDHPGWDLVYFDYNSILYVRGQRFPDLRRLRVITPFGHRDRSRIQEALGEIGYLLGENPIFFGGYKIQAFLLARNGADEAAARALRRYLELHPEGERDRETRSLIATLRERGAWR